MGRKIPCNNCQLDSSCRQCGLLGCLGCLGDGVGPDPATNSKYSRLHRWGTGEKKYENEGKDLGGPRWIRWYCTKCNARNYSQSDPQIPLR